MFRRPQLSLTDFNNHKLDDFNPIEKAFHDYLEAMQNKEQKRFAKDWYNWLMSDRDVNKRPISKAYKIGYKTQDRIMFIISRILDGKGSLLVMC